MKKTNKTIHIIVKYFYPVAAGIETNILETYSELAKEGWDITIHTSKDTLTEKNVLPDTDLIKNLKVKRYKNHWYGYIPDIDWNNAGLLCLHNFNVDHIFYFIFTAWKKILKQKTFGLVVTPHGGFNPEWSIYSKPVALLKQLYHFSIGTFLINHVVDRVRAVSEWEKAEIVKKGVKKEKVVTISNGVEPEAYLAIDNVASNEIKRKVKGFGNYILQIGRIYVIKNYETTIKALPLLPKNVTFVIAGPIGNEGYLKELKTLIEKLDIQDRVKFIGVVRGVDKFYLMKHASMMVHMALWESFCNVLHEAMSQGQVCIAADNTALPYLIKDGVNGYLVPTKDYKQLSEKINYVLLNSKNKQIIKMQARNRALGLKDSWVNTAQKMETTYENLLKNI